MFTQLTTEETDIKANLMADIETYTDEMFLKFIMGIEPLSEYDAYVEKVKGMGIDEVVKVRGKGDKMREIPLVESLSEEFLLYLKAVEVMCGRKRSLTEPLFVTYSGSPLYPKYVDRVVKSALGSVGSIRGQKSPHVLRHSLATELMNGSADLNSIKELLGHSSLAATQVYTHSSIARLKDIYERAHPRAKNGGKHGD